MRIFHSMTRSPILPYCLVKMERDLKIIGGAIIGAIIGGLAAGTGGAIAGGLLGLIIASSIE